MRAYLYTANNIIVGAVAAAVRPHRDQHVALHGHIHTSHRQSGAPIRNKRRPRFGVEVVRCSGLDDNDRKAYARTACVADCLRCVREHGGRNGDGSASERECDVSIRSANRLMDPIESDMLAEVGCTRWVAVTAILVLIIITRIF